MFNQTTVDAEINLEYDEQEFSFFFPIIISGGGGVCTKEYSAGHSMDVHFNFFTIIERNNCKLNKFWLSISILFFSKLPFKVPATIN